MATFVVVVANGEVQLICGSMAEAKREMKDLKKMECEQVRGYAVEGEHAGWAAEDIADHLAEGKPFGRKGAKRIETAYPVKVTFI